MFRAWFPRITAFGNALTRRHLEWIFRAASTRPLTVICLFAGAVALSLAMSSSIHFETDIFRLFPSRQAASFKELITDVLIVFRHHVSKPAGASLAVDPLLLSSAMTWAPRSRIRADTSMLSRVTTIVAMEP